MYRYSNTYVYTFLIHMYSQRVAYYTYCSETCLFPLLTFRRYISLSENIDWLYYLTAAEFSILWMYHNLTIIFPFLLVTLNKFYILILLQQYTLQIKFPKLAFVVALSLWDLYQSFLI